MKNCLEVGGEYPDETSPCDSPDTPEMARTVMIMKIGG